MMPTGYTAKLMEEGQTFEEFAWTCARAFGALVTMRDDPLDAPVPEKFETSNYSKQRLEDSKAELDRLESMGGSERIAFGEEMRDKAVREQREWLAKERAQNERLSAMRKQVETWEPPSPEHAEYKTFMLDQIRISMNDCSYIERSIAALEAKSPASYYAEAVAGAARGIQFHAQHRAEEVERVESRNRWIKQLRESLKPK